MYRELSQPSLTDGKKSLSLQTKSVIVFSWKSLALVFERNLIPLLLNNRISEREAGRYLRDHVVHLTHFTDEEMEAHRGEVTCLVSPASDHPTKIQFQVSVARRGLCLGPILTLGHTLPQDSRAMHTCCSIDRRQMRCIFQNNPKSCKCGQFQVKLLDLQF